MSEQTFVLKTWAEATVIHQTSGDELAESVKEK